MSFRRYNYVDFATNRDYTFASYYIDEDLIKYKRGCGDRVVDVEVPSVLNKELKDKKFDIHLSLAVTISLLTFLSTFLIDIIANPNRISLIMIFFTFATILVIPINNTYKSVLSKFLNLSLYEHLCDYMHTNQYFQYCDIDSSFKQIKQFVQEDVISDINLKHIERYLKRNYYDSDCLKDLYFHSFKSLVPGSIIISILSFVGSLVGSISTLIRLFNSISGNRIVLIFTVISYFIFIITITLVVSMHKYNKCINDLNCIYYITSFGSLDMPYDLNKKDVSDRLIVWNFTFDSNVEMKTDFAERVYLLIKSLIPKSTLTVRDIHLNNKIFILFENYCEIVSDDNFILLKCLQNIESFNNLFGEYCCQ